jgi:hypothetical protein
LLDSSSWLLKIDARYFYYLILEKFYFQCPIITVKEFSVCLKYLVQGWNMEMCKNRFSFVEKSWQENRWEKSNTTCQ